MGTNFDAHDEFVEVVYLPGLAGIHPSLHGTHGQFSCLSCHPKTTSPKLRINAMGEMKGTQDLQRSGDIGYGPYSRKPHLVP